MSSVNFALLDLCSLIPDVPSVGRQFSGRATVEEALRVNHERKPSGRFSGACFADHFQIADNSGIDGDKPISHYRCCETSQKPTF